MERLRCPRQVLGSHIEVCQKDRREVQVVLAMD